MSGEIHIDNPFVPPPDRREPLRRLRGRLAAPVTVLTAGEAAEPGATAPGEVGTTTSGTAHRAGLRARGWAGLTVSSVLVVEGNPGLVVAPVGELTDFFDVTARTRAFVVHVLDDSCGELADRFAGLRPAPGGPFTGEDVDQTAWGPRLSRIPDWAGCRLEAAEELGYQRLVVGSIEEIHLSELTRPLVYFRGRYRHLG